MIDDSPTTFTDPLTLGIRAFVDWPAAYLENLVQLQRLQLEYFGSIERPLVGLKHGISGPLAGRAASRSTHERRS